MSQSQSALSKAFYIFFFKDWGIDGEKKKKEIIYLELDRFLEDRGATRGLVLCSETVLRHNAVTEGRDLEMGKKKKIIKFHSSTPTVLNN